MWKDEEEKNEGFGEYLRRERELRNITLDEISKAIKINKYYLKAIEDEQFNLLPGISYLKGFVRNYARYIGIDPDDAILRLELTIKEEEKNKKEIETDIKTKKYNRYLWLYSTLAGILLVFIVLFVVIYPAREPVKKRVEKQPLAKTEQQKEKDLPPSDQKESENLEQKTVKKEGLSVKIQAKEKTWIMVRLDEAKPFDVVLWEGNIVHWKANNRISLRIGNAKGIDITFNGIPLKNIGEEGEVVGIVLPDDLQRFQ